VRDALGTALAAALTPADVAEAAIRVAMDELGAVGGAVVRLEADGATAGLVGEAGLGARVRARLRHFRAAPGTLTAAVAAAGAPRWFGAPAALAAEFPEVAALLAGTAVARVGAYPLRGRAGARAVLYLGFAAAPDAGPAGAPPDALADVAELCAAALGRAEAYAAGDRARADAQAAARWARFLGRASESLAEAVGLDDVLGRVTGLVVPGLADYCQVMLVEDRAGARPPLAEADAPPDPARSQLRRVAAAAVDPDVEAVLAALDARYPVALDRPNPMCVAVRGGAPVRVERVDEALFGRAAEDAEHLALLRRLGLRSLVAVPLVARGRAIGVLALGHTGREQRFTAADEAVAAELARRAGLAVANALLYDQARRAQAEAEAAGRAKDDFLATMSHELRTPLSAIIGYAELMRDGVVAPVAPGQHAPLDRIAASARHLLALIEEILDYAKADVRREALDAAPLDAAALARDAGAMIEPVAATHGIDFRVEAPERPVPMTGDARRLRQVLLNLLGNAVRYTDAGSVALRVAPGDGCVAFAVEDTGIGIAPEHLGRIFEPFWQVEQGHTRRRGGTGLGLAVARGLAERMGGTLTVESARGRGSTFTLVVPAAPPGAAAARA
jgi:signal transduction histidine kinase